MAQISTALLSEVQDADRLDAEFFDPHDLAIIRRLHNEGGERLGSICEVLNGKTPASYTATGDVPVVRSGDLVAPLIYPGCGPDFLATAKVKGLVYLRNGDVLISSIGMGSIGKISLVMEADSFVTVSEVTILRSRGYPPEVLFAYLTTAAGQRQILRQITGATGQQHLLKSKVESILIPAPPKKTVAASIRESCQRAWELERELAKQHARTHEIFARALGI